MNGLLFIGGPVDGKCIPVKNGIDRIRIPEQQIMSSGIPEKIVEAKEAFEHPHEYRKMYFSVQTKKVEMMVKINLTSNDVLDMLMEKYQT